MKSLFHLLMATSLVVVCQAAGAHAQSPADGTLCAFRPQNAICQKIYQQALKSDDPTAQAVKAAYQAYGKYLRPGGQGLTQADRKYLADNQIDLPPDLEASDLAGLHNLLADTSLSGDGRRIAAINFLNRAVEAELFCHFNQCDPKAAGPLTS